MYAPLRGHEVISCLTKSVGTVDENMSKGNIWTNFNWNSLDCWLQSLSGTLQGAIILYDYNKVMFKGNYKGFFEPFSQKNWGRCLCIPHFRRPVIFLMACEQIGNFFLMILTICKMFIKVSALADIHAPFFGPVFS